MANLATARFKNFVRLGGLAGVGVVTFVLTAASMLFIPGTPRHRSLEQIYILDSYRSKPEASEAGRAFDEFIRLGEQSALLEATMVSGLAALAVALVARLGKRLTVPEVMFVASGFMALQLLRWLDSVGDAMMLLLGTIVFGGTLWLIERLRAKRLG